MRFEQAWKIIRSWTVQPSRKIRLYDQVREPSLKEFSRRKFRDSFRETIPNDSETSRREIPTDVVTDPLNYYSRVYVHTPEPEPERLDVEVGIKEAVEKER